MAWFINPIAWARGIGSAAIFDVAKDVLKGAGREMGAAAIQRVKSLIEHRDEFFEFVIQGLGDATASANWDRRWRDRQFHRPRSYGAHELYRAGDETRFALVFTLLYVSLGEPSEAAKRLQLFRWLGHLTDEEFDERMALLENNLGKQWLQQAHGVVGRAFERASDTAQAAFRWSLNAAGTTFVWSVDQAQRAWNATDQAATDAAPRVGNFADWLESQRGGRR